MTGSPLYEVAATKIYHPAEFPRIVRAGMAAGSDRSPVGGLPSASTLLLIARIFYPVVLFVSHRVFGLAGGICGHVGLYAWGERPHCCPSLKGRGVTKQRSAIEKGARVRQRKLNDLKTALLK